jgi:hypothetical protein
VANLTVLLYPGIRSVGCGNIRCPSRQMNHIPSKRRQQSSNFAPTYPIVAYMVIVRSGKNLRIFLALFYLKYKPIEILEDIIN